MEEILLQIENYPNYKVSNFGYIYSIKTHRKLKPFISKAGYEMISLCNSEGVRKYSVHRLVAKHFCVPETSEDIIVNHKDGIRLNNKVDNLEWTTYSKNNLHSFQIGTNVPVFGEKHFASKLSNNDVIEIKKLLEQGLSQQKIAKKFNVSPTYISHIKRGEARKNG